MKPSPPPAKAQGADRWLVALAMAGIAAAAFGAYFNSFSGVFVFDDEPAILRNATIRHAWALGQSLCPPADATVSGRPVANFSFALNYALSGTQVWSYHAVNLLIHILAGLTLFGIVRRTLQFKGTSSSSRTEGCEKREKGIESSCSHLASRSSLLLAFGAALLWTLHPLQTEAVTYIVQRVESLMALFFLLTFYFFIRSLKSPHPRRWRFLAVVACLLGMGTKEVMAAAPILLVLYDRTFVTGSFRRAWAERRGFYLTLAATWLPLATLVASTGWNRGGTVGFSVGMSPWVYWLAQFEAVVHYLRLSVWPHPLIFDYEPSRTLPPVEVALYALLVLALAAATLWALRRRPVAGFLGAWFLVILAPTSVVPSSVQMIVEHRMYLPLAAVTVAMAWGLHRWLGRRSLVVFLALAAGLGWATAHRNEVYRSERAIWNDTIAKAPKNDRAHNNLGNVLLKEGEVAEAVARYQVALRLRPDSEDTHYNLGNACQRLGKSPEATQHYEQALKINPLMPDAQTALGKVFEASGRDDEAAVHYRQALRMSPNYADAHHHLGMVLGRAGKLEEAMTHFEQALRNSTLISDVHNSMGNALRAADRIQEAIAHYEQALKLDPHFYTAHRNLGRTFAAANRVPEAIAQFEQVLKFTPTAPEAHNELGMVLVMAGRVPEGIVHFKEALRLDPNQPKVHVNLAIALEFVGRSAEAAAHIETARRQGLALPQ